LIYRIEGHAIICDRDCISDKAGTMPAFLRHEADWAYFQGHLDRAAIVITGRLGHEAHPNKPGRKRLVFTSTAADGFCQQGDVSFVDPQRVALGDAFSRIAPAGGMIAVTGGTAVFDWFANHGGFDAFHLVRAEGHAIEKGRPLFSSMKLLAEEALRDLGLTCKEDLWLHAGDRIRLQIFNRSS
jgi:dihydrofolate reductase